MPSNYLKKGRISVKDKKIIAYIDAQNELSANIVKLAVKYGNNGADELLIYDYSRDIEAKEKLFLTVKEIIRQVDIPVMIGLYISHFEDIKKALYTGAHKMMIKHSLTKNRAPVMEGIERFGKDKIMVEVDDCNLLSESLTNNYKSLGVCGLLIKHVELNDSIKKTIESSVLPIIIRDSLSKNDMFQLISMKNVIGVATNYFQYSDESCIMKAKLSLKNQGIGINTFESKIIFSEFKLNSEGMIPVITQDYRTSEVLMLAYMNEEAFNQTLETGKMTYFSRSRNELWTKGLTSGHFQYVKSLTIDCDKDTILAKVQQIGAACHTGNKTCFFEELVTKSYDDTNPLTVFEEVYDVIMDRKLNPKEGSYTNYLFDKGIDKILKKCGEEATEIVIAAKNPNAEELKYEISDFLYHVMVLMAECGLDWNDVVKELAHRR